MERAEREYRISERHACRLLGQWRGTQRYEPIPRADEDELTAAVIALASQYGRYGYKKTAALLQIAGWKVGRDRVEQIWRREGLKVPQKQRPRRRLWLNDGSCIRLRPKRANHVWSYDFVSARTHDGRRLRILALIDEYTRECLALRGTKMVGHIASLFLGQEVRPVVLLNGDDAGRVRQGALMKELYAGHEKAVLMLGDVLGKEKCEIEDIIGEVKILPALENFVGNNVSLNQDDRSKGSLVDQINSAASRQGVQLPDGWKPEVARRIVVAWSTIAPKDMPKEILGRAEALFVVQGVDEPFRESKAVDRSVARRVPIPSDFV